jgi:hypothetical protein
MSFQPQDTDFIPYYKWKRRNPDLVEMQDRCPDCWGDGEEECPCCGSLVECERCSATGKVIPLPDGKTVTLKMLYWIQRRRDKAAVEAYLEGKKIPASIQLPTPVERVKTISHGGKRVKVQYVKSLFEEN